MKEKPDRRPSQGIMEFLALISSARAAVVLMIILTVICIVGTFIPQEQPEEQYLKAYGSSLTQLLKGTGLTNLYHSWWFLALLGVISANLILSSINRARKVLETYYKPQVTLPLNSSIRPFSFLLPFEDAQSRLSHELRTLGYKVLEEKQEKECYTYADKRRFSNWGSSVAHVGILLLFLGGMYGNWPGVGMRKDVQILEGEQVNVPEAGFSLKLDKFEARCNEERLPLLYRSTLSLVQNGQEKVQKDVEVNKPLKYEGYTVYQSSFGVVGFAGTATRAKEKAIPYRMIRGEDASLHLKGGKGKDLLIVAHQFFPDFAFTPQGPGSRSDFPVNPVAQLMVNEDPEKSGEEGWRELGWLSPDHPLRYKGYNLTMDHVISYTGLSVKKDPGLPYAIAGFTMIMVGILLAYMAPHKIIRGRVKEKGDGVEVFLQGARRDKAQVYDEEIARLETVLKEGTESSARRKENR